MSYRPLTKQEESDVKKIIDSVKSDILIRQQYLNDIESQLKQGLWKSDIDYSSLPLPEPDCYICANKITGVERCLLSHDYRTVCSDYLHFSKR